VLGTSPYEPSFANVGITSKRVTLRLQFPVGILHAYLKQKTKLRIGASTLGHQCLLVSISH
jgi:hypothetical protein